MGYKHKTKTGKKDTTTVDDKNEYFEEITEFEETIFEPGPEPEPTPKKDPLFFYQKPAPPPPPNEYEIDVDGDQVPELKVSFSRIDKQQMSATVEYADKAITLNFNYEHEFTIQHQDPSDGRSPYKFYFFVPDYKKVFYANEKQWPTLSKEQMEQDKIWELAKPGSDHLKPQRIESFESYFSIKFREIEGKYKYIAQYITHEGVQKTAILDLGSNHEFKGFKPSEGDVSKGITPQRGIVRDTTDERQQVENDKDRSVASYTIPIEVGKIGTPDTEGDHNKYNHVITIQKSPNDNGLAAISISGWSGTNLIPIPGKFVDIPRPKITEKANHLELIFEGANYNTTLSIHQQYLMLNKKNSVGTKDEVVSLNVYTGSLPKNTRGVFYDSKDYFNKRFIYKTRYINGEKVPYHQYSDDKVDEDEFHQKATNDAREKINNQPSSSSIKEERLNIRLRETQAIGMALKGQTFTDMNEKEVPGDQIFLEYIDLLISVRRMTSLIGKEGDLKEVVALAMLKDAQNKADRFWNTLSGFVLVGINLDKFSLQSCHSPNTPKKEKLVFDIRQISNYIKTRDWARVEAVLDSFHSTLESKVLHHKQQEVEELYDKKAKEDAKRIAQKKGAKGVSKADIAQARTKYASAEAQLTKSAKGNFNLDNRYNNFIKEEAPPTQVYRAKALFYPDYLNVGEGKAKKEPIYIDLPLYYYQKDGEWHIVSLVSKDENKSFKAVKYEVKEGETHPPDEMFATLDSKNHLPKGLLYYETHDGYSSQIAINSKTAWWEYAGYVALALFAIGLLVSGIGAVAGLGSASLAGEFFFAAGVIGAAGAVGSMIDQNERGTTTVKSFTVNLLDIVGAFIGAIKIFKGASMIKAANSVKAGTKTTLLSKLGLKELGGRYRYIALEKLDLGVDATMVLIGTADGFAQISAILEGPGTLGEKTADIAAILPFLALQGGIFLGTVRGRIKNIKDAQKNKIIDKLNLKSAKGTGASDVKSVQDLDPNLFPAVNRLKASGDVFSKDGIEQVMGLVRRYEDFEPIARVIHTMDKARLKALCARFSEKNVLYALYTFDGNLYKAHRHLLKNKAIFNDRGHNVYMNMKVYEELRGGVEGAPLRNQHSLATKTMRAKTKHIRLKNAHKKALETQTSETKRWNEAQKKLTQLKKAKAEAEKELAGLPERIKNTEQELVNNEAEAESFSKLTKHKQLLNEKGVDAWKKVQDDHLKRVSKALRGLESKAQRKATEIEQKQLEFEKAQYEEAIRFYKDLNLKRNEIKQSNDPNAPQKLGELDSLEADFIKKQEAKAETFKLEQQERRKILNNTETQIKKQKAAVATETKKGAEYAKAATVIKKGMALRKRLNQLHIKRNQLLDEVENLEKKIQKLRLDMLTQKGRNKFSIERQINELTAAKNEQQSLLVQKELDIAHIEKELATFAKEENAYTLNTKKSIDVDALKDEASIVKMLQQNVAPKDLEQLKVFIDVQAKQVQSQKDQGLNAAQLAEKKAQEVLTLEKTQATLIAEQKALFNQQAQLMPSRISGSAGRRGAKRKGNKGGNKKRESIKARLENIMNKLEEIKTQLNNTKQGIEEANNTVKIANAKKIEADAKYAQEKAKLETYQQFYQLQKNIAAGKQNVANTRQEFNRLKGSLNATSRRLKQTDASITHDRALEKQSIDSEVAKLAELTALSKKEYQGYSKSYKRAVEAYEQAKKHYDLLQRLSQEEYKLAVAREAKAKKLVNIMSIIIASGRSILKNKTTPGTDLGVFKAWWKVNKILKKLLNPNKGKEVKDLIRQETYAIAEQKKLESFLKKYVSDSETLPNDDASLWKLLIQELENTGKSYYTNNSWNELLSSLVAIQKSNTNIKNIKYKIAELSQKVSAFPIVIINQKLSPDDEKLLEQLDEIITANENQKDDKEKEPTELTPKQIKAIMEYLNNNTEKKEE